MNYIVEYPDGTKRFESEKIALEFYFKREEIYGKEKMRMYQIYKPSRIRLSYLL